MSKSRHQPLRLVSSRPGAEPHGRGKIVHDHRGNAIWDWAIDPEVLTNTTTTGLLRKLADPAQQLTLAEEPTDSPPARSGDPYNSTRK
jgi:hypothetical protein